MKKIVYALMAICLLLSSCKKEEEVKLTQSGLNPARFETTIDGKPNKLYVLKNSKGMEVCVTNIGMRIASITVPDKDGKMTDVVLGFDNIEQYKSTTNNFGSVIGRYANRIANASFKLNRVTYDKLRNNNGIHSIHGGPGGFHTRYFAIAQESDTELSGTYLSPHMEEGFPGEILLKVIYSLTEENALDIKYEVITNYPTVVNITNHSYFNISGDLSNQVMNEVLYIDAANYTPSDAELIPTGEIAKVAGTPLDFTNPKPIGRDINNELNEAIKNAHGFDLNYVLNHPGDINNLAAKVTSPVTGITLEVYTTEPGLQLYTTNRLNETGKGGKTYGNYSAFCLETQHFPDSPNQPNFPSTEIRPDKMFESHTIYKFGVEK
ncbi:galactose mutarotase [Bacteroidales bacterium OttesenSCG-928-I14]|nr:galactose mutarotase [Bacteroidales bacterium OttesenSCG-928-I14]